MDWSTPAPRRQPHGRRRSASRARPAPGDAERPRRLDSTPRRDGSPLPARPRRRHAGQMRIAYLADTTTGNGFYRGTGPMTALAQVRGHDVRAVPINDGDPPLTAVHDVDVLHIHRYGEQGAIRLAREAKAHGAAVAWDNDDDIGSVPKGTPGYRKQGGMQWERRLAGMRKIFEVA